MSRVWLVIAWVAATALVSFGTFQALSLAQSEIGTGDLSPVVVASTEDSATPQSSPDAAPPPVTPTAGGPPSLPESTQTTSTTVQRPATTAATESAAPTTRTVQSPGGAVTVRVAPGVVEFVGAVPAPGFRVEVDDAGPSRVRVEFESEVARHEVRIEWESGELEISLG